MLNKRQGCYLNTAFIYCVPVMFHLSKYGYKCAIPSLMSRALVAHADIHPSYLRGRDQEDHSNSSRDTILNKPI
jgi:hypothetical protein